METPARTLACSICGNTDGNIIYVAREMMFGYRDSFRYLECAACHCVQLLDIPADMSKYYPANYYSFSSSGGLKKAIKQKRDDQSYGKSSVAGWFAELLLGKEGSLVAVRRAGISINDRVLDVGCGAGELIRSMKRLGYRSLAGVDPYIANDIHFSDGVSVRKCEVGEIGGQFDVVMLHHSFEHMDNSAETLASLACLLSPRGRLLIRIPVTGSFAWHRYGVNWVNLDAPRHLFLYSPESMELLANACGLQITDVTYDGTAAQFIGSEQYEHNISLDSPRSYYSSRFRRLLNWPRVWRLSRLAQKLNQNKQGDFACFELRKVCKN